MEYALILRLVIAAALGALLGLERSIAGKQAGLRTYALVSLGSCLFTVTGVLASYELSLFSGINPLQIAGSIVIGIGFIGAGLAAMRGDTNHVELTTAAGIWLAAGLGMAAGFGLYTAALTSAVLGIVIFSLLARFEHYMRTRFGSSTETNNG